MSYYNKNYYPTPNNVIDTMIEGLDLSRKSVLDPSAGMGAILDRIKYKCKKTYAIEIEDNFQSVLKDKGHTVLHTDFLTYSGTHAFDYIIMNPPFDNGAKHFLKALEILRPGSTLVCLLNWETIDNPYTEDRTRLIKEVNRYDGQIVNLGNAFNESERKTNVSVGMIKLTKPSLDEMVLDFPNMANSKINHIDDVEGLNEVERYDAITSYCRAYQRAVDQLPILYKAIKDMSLYTSPFITTYVLKDMIKALIESMTDTYNKGTYTDTHNEFVSNFQSRAWAKLFEDSKITGLMTEKVKADFESKRKLMGGFDLNPENILLAFGAIYNQRDQIQNACIVEAFNWLTQYSEKNRSYFGETWKTNSHYVVGSKIILPVTTSYGSVCYRSMERMDDLDRALCLVTGKSFNQIIRASESIKGCYSYSSLKETECKSEFFKIKLYLKGTAHLTFKDETVRTMFNRMACADLGWQLPENETFKGKNKRR